GDRLTAISLDLLRKPGYDTAEEKSQRCKEWKDSGGVVVVESARTTTTSYALPDEPVIIVTCSWQSMRGNMMARCAKKDKRFRDDYWDEYKLTYESSRRYLNFASKNLDPKQVKHFN